MRAVILVGLLLAGVDCAHTAPRQQPHPNLEPLWNEYETLADHKAIAVAGSLRGSRWVAAVVAGHPDATSAMNAALAECAERRVRSRVQAACVEYARDAKIVWRGH